jgi:hypothetical protein
MRWPKTCVGDWPIAPSNSASLMAAIFPLLRLRPAADKSKSLGIQN